ncbi:MAG: hypothetical protein GYA24_21100 [Candidatus Lokiarchaeota archaeon]|nr:hypothetical protein [Candidatus Lokiarchaeota archaeon]
MVKITLIFDDIPEKPRLVLPIAESQTLLYAMSDLADLLDISLSRVSLLSTSTRLGIIDTAWGHDLDYMSRNFGTEYLISIEGSIDTDELRSRITHAQKKIDEEERRKEAASRKEKAEMVETARVRFAKLKDVVEMSESIDIARLSKATDIDEDVIWDDVFNWCKKFGFKVNGNQLVFGSGDKVGFFKYIDGLLERA